MSYYDLPERIIIGHRRFVAGALDAHRVPIAGWMPPVERRVFSIDPTSTSEPITVGSQQVIIDAQVLSSWPMHPKDKIDCNGRTYIVEGVSQDYTTGPFDFRPGYVTNVRYA